MGSTAAAKPDSGASGTVPEAIERYFQVSLFLLIVTGFVTLTSTGRLDSPSVLVVSLALLARAYLLLRNRTIIIPERLTTYFTVGYVLFYTADLFLVSGSFVTASVHLVLFGMVVKIFSVQRDRDHLYLAILSFMEVLAAAILTVDTVFLIAFCTFMLLAVATFISMEMRRSAMAAGRSLAASPQAGRRMEMSLSGVAAVLMVAIFVGATGIFFILPRLSAGYLGAYAPHNEFVSGFSDRVQLGEIGRIKQSDTVVMHVSIWSDNPPPDLKWRGLSLTYFDGRQWANPIPQAIESKMGDGRYGLLDTQISAHNLESDWMRRPRMFRVLRYRVIMEPLGTNVLFFATVPASMQSRLREIGVDEGGAVYNNDRNRLTESYEASSILPQAAPAQLRTASDVYPPDIASSSTYLQLPEVDPRVRDLAAQITAGASTEYDKAAAIESYLHSHYGYSLEMASTPPPDPLVYFLFERKEGHCEYFASAMTVMLRTLGIPARIVNGFRMGEFNDLTGNYIIRGRDAHSWVEAYIPGYSWVAFDPTPPDPKPGTGSWNRFLLYVDAGREFWREWVINYDFFHQRTLGTTATFQTRRLVIETRLWVRRHYVQLLMQARRVHQRATDQPLEMGLGAAAVAGILLLLLNLRRIWRALKRRRLARNPRREPRAAASLWYERMTRTVARRGFRKSPSQTPEEFVTAIADARLRSSVARFTEHYERARFGESPEDAERLPELYEEIGAK